MLRPSASARRGRSPLLLVLAAACGYTAARSGASHLRVSGFRNDTAQVEVAGLFASALREEVEARGRLSESEGPLLSGELLAVRSGPSAINAAGALAFRLDADVILRVVEPAGNVSYEDRATFGEDYLVGVDVLGTEANRRAALRRLAKAASRELMTRYEIAGRMRR
ncbi:MAG: LPS assembly lipoprotein LptE [Myxococcales bacterium]